MRIYIAGPYSASTDEQKELNVCSAMTAGLALIQKGHAPFCPHTSHWWDLHAEREIGRRLSWDEWMKVVTPFITVCEGFLYLAPSRGADIELLIARATGRRIFYSLKEVPYDNGRNAYP